MEQRALSRYGRPGRARRRGTSRPALPPRRCRFGTVRMDAAAGVRGRPYRDRWLSL